MWKGGHDSGIAYRATATSWTGILDKAILVAGANSSQKRVIVRKGR
jgi:hypothetical protein